MRVIVRLQKRNCLPEVSRSLFCSLMAQDTRNLNYQINLTQTCSKSQLSYRKYRFACFHILLSSSLIQQSERESSPKTRHLEHHCASHVSGPRMMLRKEVSGLSITSLWNRPINTFMLVLIICAPSNVIIFNTIKRRETARFVSDPDRPILGHCGFVSGFRWWIF